MVEFVGYNVFQFEAAQFTEFLKKELSYNNEFNIIGDERISGILRELGVEDARITETDTASRLGEMLYVDKVIMGKVNKFTKLGDYYYISVDIVDVKRGKVYITEDIECKDVGEFQQAAKTIAARLREKLGYESQKNRKGQKVETVKHKKRKSWRGRYEKLSLGVGYPYLYFSWDFMHKLSLEPRIAFGYGIAAMGSRLNYGLKEWGKWAAYTGFEYYFINFETKGIKGFGSLMEGYIGGSYSITKDLDFNLDIGPAYLYIKESGGLSVNSIGDWIINTSIKFYCFGL